MWSYSSLSKTQVREVCQVAPLLAIKLHGGV